MECKLKDNVTVKYAEQWADRQNLYILAMLATPEEWAEGIGWYPFARHAIAREAAALDVDEVKLRGVVAALSPMRNWDANIRDAVTVVMAWRLGIPADGTIAVWAKAQGRTMGGLGAGYAPVRMAYAVLAHDGDPLDLLTGPKVRRFFMNLCGDLSVVTVDSHAFHAYMGNFTDGGVHSGSIQFPESLYLEAEEAYIWLAGVLGIEPAEAQALVWVVRKALLAKAKAVAKRMREAVKAAKAAARKGMKRAA